jgi:hypothetical protein
MLYSNHVVPEKSRHFQLFGSTLKVFSADMAFSDRGAWGFQEPSASLKASIFVTGYPALLFLAFTVFGGAGAALSDRGASCVKEGEQPLVVNP